MVQTPRVPTHWFRIETSSYDNHIWNHPYIPGTEHLHYVDATSGHPPVLPSMMSRPDVAHTYNHFQPSGLLSAPHRNETESPPGLVQLSCSFLTAGSSRLLDDCGNMGFLKPPGLCNLSGSFYPSPDPLLNNIYSPTPHHSALDPTLSPDLSCRRPSWPTANILVNPVDECLSTPTNYYPSTSPLHDASPSPDLMSCTSEPYFGAPATPASYPCLWTEGGVSCDVMVRATRPHMNRHLHAYHGFSGRDIRQTKCYWAGCGETMQQGSIARHTVTCHLRAKVTCPMCSKKLSRQDVISKHQRVCPAASAWP